MQSAERKLTSVFERHLTDGVAWCVAGGLLPGKAAMATLVGAPIEAPVMRWLARICVRTERWFASSGARK